MFLVALIIMTFPVGCSDKYDDSQLTNRVDKLESRIDRLEELCSQMNTNISSLQTIINALQNRDYIKNVTPITKEDKTIGYTINFAQGNPITIYHGKDGVDGANGKDGVNGANGKDGSTPLVGVKKHTDGIYYWTVNNEWLLDDNYKMIKAQAIDGKDGEDGANGVDGTNGFNGTNGKDGITPKLQIQDDYWYVSYNNGLTWTVLGKATGEDGTDGSDGEDGDKMFNEIIIKDNNVIFVLSNDTQFTVPMSPVTQLTIEINEVGSLNTILTKEQKKNITSLIVIGQLNDKDLKVIHLMESLEILNLKDAKGVSTVNPYSDLLPNKTIKEVVLPTECQGINLSNMLALETVEVSADSLHFSCGTSSMLNTIIYSEGITVIPNQRNILQSFNNIIFPSSMLRISHDALYTSCGYNNVVITCFAINPPIIGDWEWHRITDYYGSYSRMSFDEPQNEWENQDFSHITVKVPSESIELYRQAKCWRKLNVVAIEQ